MMCIHECRCVLKYHLFFNAGFLKKRKEKETKHIFLGGDPSKQQGEEQGKKSLPYFR